MNPAKYQEHPVREVLKRLLDLEVHPELSTSALAIDEQKESARATIFSIAALIRARLEHTPAVLASEIALNSLEAVLRETLVDLEGYLGNPHVSHIKQAADHLQNEALSLLWGLPYVPSEDGNPESWKVFERYQDHVTRVFRHFGAEEDRLQGEIDRISYAVNNSASTFQAIEDAAKERIESLKAATTLQKEFVEKEQERIDRVEMEIKAYKDAFDKLFTESDTAAKGVISSLTEQAEKAGVLSGLIGTDGMTRNYQSTANIESRTANLFRYMTIGIFFIGMGCAMYAFVTFAMDDINVKTVGTALGRLLFALIITAPAWYTAKESARHRTNADRARQVELELAALEPFLYPLPEENKGQLRTELAKRYFGRQIDAHEPHLPFDVAKFAGLLKETTELVKVLKKDIET